MTDLLDVDRAGEGCFLSIVALKLEETYVRRIELMGFKSRTSTPCLSFEMQ